MIIRYKLMIECALTWYSVDGLIRINRATMLLKSGRAWEPDSILQIFAVKQ